MHSTNFLRWRGAAEVTQIGNSDERGGEKLTHHVTEPTHHDSLIHGDAAWARRVEVSIVVACAGDWQGEAQRHTVQLSHAHAGKIFFGGCAPRPCMLHSFATR